nr:tRNA lysidine(34) synthetase TilS [Rhizobiaceae bacterium]
MNDPAALFHDFDFWRSHGVLAAVSGGGDSLALLLLLHDHLKTLHPSPPLYAATVDHGLRTGSAAEAQTVSELCGKLGLAHVTLRWNRSEGGRATPQAARDARYRLLAEAAQRFGVHAIATGHTRDDQAETVAMRLERGTGRGAAGMATISSFDEGRLWIARPLLGVTRQALRAELRRLGVDWIDDPTNENPAQERVRVRNALATAPERAQALLARANKASATRESEALQAAALLHASAVFAPPFGVRLDLAKLEAADKPIRLLLLAALVAVIGGLEHLPAQERVASVWERISGSVADAKRAVRASLGRCTLTVSRRTLSVRREARNLPSPVDPHKAFGIWDGRYSLGIVAGEPLSIPCGFVIAPLDAK